MTEIEKLTNRLEYLFLKAIIKVLREDTMSVPDARSLAREFLKLEPFQSIEEARTKVLSFTIKHPALEELEGYMKKYHEEQKTSEVIEKMRKYMKSNEIDKALEVATNTA